VSVEEVMECDVTLEQITGYLNLSSKASRPELWATPRASRCSSS
jgi:hypothetical protein